MEIRALRESDDRSGFRSGDADLDRFFHRYAGQNQFRHHLSVTYVAAEGGRLAGYFAVSVGHLELDQLPLVYRRKLPRYPLPILRLARLAVDESFRGSGIGTRLLKAVLQMALRLAEDFGCTGVVVDAKPAAMPFYEKFGFTPLDAVEGIPADRPQPVPMFLAINKIRAAL